MSVTIRVWKYEDAPEKYRSLSQHGGDEDWLAFVPEGMGRPGWMDVPAFGCCDVSAHPVRGGVVYIGAHA